MNAYERGKVMQQVITKLYEDEGRSKSYISRATGIDRNVLRQLINEWGLVQLHQDEKKIRRFLAEYKEFILARIKDGWTQRQIFTACNKGREFYLKVLQYDDDIYNATRMMSFRNKYRLPVIEGEAWKPIFGCSKYEVSNQGRVRNQYGIMMSEINKRSGYETIGLTNDSGKRKNYRLHRLVAHAFCDGFSEERNEVNHKDGNVLNNTADNLEWVSSSENLIHSYQMLGRQRKTGNRLKKFKIIYKDKFEFRSIASFARFVGISETQAARWIYESPVYHDIQLITKIDDSNK